MKQHIEFDAIPPMAAVTGNGSFVYQKRWGGWMKTGSSIVRDVGDMPRPATVVFLP